jgi:hypothetical protein
MASVTMNTGTEDDKELLELVTAVQIQFLIAVTTDPFN